MWRSTDNLIMERSFCCCNKVNDNLNVLSANETQLTRPSTATEDTQQETKHHQKMFLMNIGDEKYNTETES